MTFDQYIAAYVLGRISTADLPAAATQALLEEYDSADLGALAGSTGKDYSLSELDELWRRGLKHLEKTLPTRADAARTLRDHYATLVSSGELAPRAGAAEIASIELQVRDDLPSGEYVGDDLGVADLLGLYDWHDDVPDWDDHTHKEIDDKIIAECRRLITT